jgi:hypothetical protein
VSILSSLIEPATKILDKVIGIWIDLPEIDTTLLVPVMMGMLGLGAMRSYEKVQGVSREK